MVVHINRTLELVFGWGIREILQCALVVNCSHINELDVRLLNFSIRTFIDQVMVFFTLNSLIDERLACRGQHIKVRL